MSNKSFPDNSEVYTLMEKRKALLTPEEKERRWQVILRSVGPFWAKYRQLHQSKRATDSNFKEQG